MAWAIDHIEAVAGVLSALIALAALAAAWVRQRRAELRRDDVHRWADEAIAALQAVRLITAGTRMKILAEEERARVVQLMFDTSILVERGRMFFRNAPYGRHGIDKPAAYRGRRPEILDQLVLAHQIACAWSDAGAEDRAKMGVVAQDALRSFVSLVQAEVGRQRTASADTRRRGRAPTCNGACNKLIPTRADALDRFETLRQRTRHSGWCNPSRFRIVHGTETISSGFAPTGIIPASRRELT